MLSGTGTDLSTKPEEVYTVMVLQNLRMTQDYVSFQKLLLKAIWQKCPLIKVNNQIFQN